MHLSYVWYDYVVCGDKVLKRYHITESMNDQGYTTWFICLLWFDDFLNFDVSPSEVHVVSSTTLQ